MTSELCLGLHSALVKIPLVAGGDETPAASGPRMTASGAEGKLDFPLQLTDQIGSRDTLDR